jgi:hypothetical protein
LLDAQDPEGLGAQLVHSGGRVLTVDEVADAAVGLIGSRRVVQSVPAWRGGVSRVSGLAPAASQHALGLFAARGRRVLKKRHAAG